MKVLKQPEKKTYERDAQLTHTVLDIIDDVRARGDEALIAYAAKFDKMEIETVRVDPETVKVAYDKVDPETIEAIRFSAGQIRFFAEKQRECLKDLDIQSRVPGLEIGHRMVPVERCGCYVPAGRHPLPSSALMGIVTAKVAGVKHVAACSPAFQGCGTIHPAVLVAMDIAGADEIYCMGGAQAIAAFAYGTQTIEKVDLIVGPGNRFVTEAKRQVLGDVGIDSLAGPSEVLIVADETANPTFVAIDLLGQAEHDPNAKAILVCTSQEVIDRSMEELERLLPTLETREVAAQSWRDNGAVYLADSMDEAIDISNRIAPRAPGGPGGRRAGGGQAAAALRLHVRRTLRPRGLRRLCLRPQPHPAHHGHRPLLQRRVGGHLHQDALPPVRLPGGLHESGPALYEIRPGGGAPGPPGLCPAAFGGVTGPERYHRGRDLYDKRPDGPGRGHRPGTAAYYKAIFGHRGSG